MLYVITFVIGFLFGWGALAVLTANKDKSQK